MAIFQKKIIIGSVLGFVASAIGLVAVFFPSVFNLEKQRIEEKTIFLHTQKSADELFEWLKKKQESIVKLNLYYCSGQVSEEGKYARFAIKADDNVVRDRSYGYVYSEIGWGGESGTIMMREKGWIGFPVTGYRDYSAEISLWKNEMDAAYEWYAEQAEYIKPPNKEVEQICKSLHQKISGVFGTFYVNKSEMGEAYGGGGAITFLLDPMSKKDLKLRNY